MDLQKSIEESIKKVLEGDELDKIIQKNVARGINEALDSIFGYNGDATNIIKENLKGVLIPFLSKYDYSKHIIKLDAVLGQILEESFKNNNILLSNFKTLCKESVALSDTKKIKLSDIFATYMECVEKNIDTDGLEVEYDDEPHYEYVNVTCKVVYSDDEDRYWTRDKRARIYFECEHDKDLNCYIDVHHWDFEEKNEWNFDSIKEDIKLKDLSRLNDDFKLYLMALMQSSITLEIDDDDMEDSVIPEKEPEPYYE